MSFDTPLTELQQNLIDRIFEIRVQNNIPWKKLMEIAMESEPVLTKELLHQINANDRDISDLLGKLAK